jgi:hypothetical protein
MKRIFGSIRRLGCQLRNTREGTKEEANSVYIKFRVQIVKVAYWFDFMFPTVSVGHLEAGNWNFRLDSKLFFL